MALAFALATAAVPAGAVAAPGDIVPAPVANIEPTGGSSPQGLISVGDSILFTASTAAHGRELYRSDGTAAGTIRLTDINPGPGDSLTTGPDSLLNAGGIVFLLGDTGTEAELYKLEAPYTGAPVKIDVNPGPAGSNPREFVEFNGMLFFSAFDASGRELWKSDGGPLGSGTVLVADVNTDPGGDSNPEELTPVGNALFFMATDGDDGGDGDELWRTSGAIGSKTELEINSATDEGSDPRDLTSAGGRVFLAAENAAVGRELWTADEDDPAATAIQIVMGSAGSDPGNLGAFGSTLLFGADDGVSGDEPWRSNGGSVGSGGTAMVADINPGPADSVPEDFTPFAGKAFFTASDASAGGELWKTNLGPLSPGNTERVADINPGPVVSSPLIGASFDGRLWFRAASPGAGAELWATDGTSLETADIRPGPLDSGPTNFVAGAGAIYFSADDGTPAGTELWKAVIEPGPPTPPAPPASPVAPAPTKKKCKKGQKLKKGKCVKKKRRKKK